MLKNNILLGNITPNPLLDSLGYACSKCSYRGLCNYLEDNDNEKVKVESVEKLKEMEDNNG